MTDALHRWRDHPPNLPDPRPRLAAQGRASLPDPRPRLPAQGRASFPDPRPRLAAQGRATSLADSPGLSRARVCQEALALVDDEGLDALSMRRLGARLGVEAMSLYRYVRGKADLLDALHVAVLADLQPVENDDADDRRRARRRLPGALLLGGMARSLRAAMLRHPHVAALFATRPVNAPEAVAPIAYVHDTLVAAGFATADADKAVVEVGIFTVGHALAEAYGRAATHERSHKTAGPAEFRFGLNALLDGLERHRGRPRSPAPRPPAPKKPRPRHPRSAVTRRATRRHAGERPMVDSFVQRYGPWALVTGASSGIGEQLARALASRGLNLVVERAPPAAPRLARRRAAPSLRRRRCSRSASIWRGPIF